MAYTTLPTQSAGQTASAAGWANIVKADLESMMHIVVRKPSDESVVSSITLQDDNHLILPVLANEVWHVEWNLLVNGTNVGDIKCAFTFPTGGTLSFTSVANNVSDATEALIWANTTSPSTTRAFGIQSGSAATEMLAPIIGVYVNGGTGGNVTLQWAQNTSSGTATTVKANSTLWAVKLA